MSRAAALVLSAAAVALGLSGCADNGATTEPASSSPTSASPVTTASPTASTSGSPSPSYSLAPPPPNPLLDATQDDAHLESAADAYRRWQWAHHYTALDDVGWTASVHAMLGLEVPEVDRPEAAEQEWAVADD